jgi:putative FmdB family regulatory protein
MPLYEYECDACSERFELIQKFSDGPPEACPKCGKGPVQRLVSSPAFQFKGSGWYITDYARKGTSPEGESPKGDGSKGEAPKGDGSKKADTDTAASSGASGGDSKKADTTPAPAPSAPAKPSAG